MAWLEREPSLRLVAEFANATARLVSTEWLRDVARRALADDSPSLRYDGLLLSEHLDDEARDGLAREALRDEPDAELKRLLRRRVLRKARGSALSARSSGAARRSSAPSQPERRHDHAQPGEQPGVTATPGGRPR